MLNDYNTDTGYIEPLTTTIKQICQNIKALNAKKLDCYCPQATDLCGNVVWTANRNGDTIQKGCHYLANSICGCLTIEDAIQGIYDAGTSGSATEIRTCTVNDNSNYCIGLIQPNRDGYYNCVGTSNMTYNPFCCCLYGYNAYFDGNVDICSCASIDTACITTANIENINGDTACVTCVVSDCMVTDNLHVDTVCSMTTCADILKCVNYIWAATDSLSFRDGLGHDIMTLCSNTGCFTNVNATNGCFTNLTIPQLTMCCDTYIRIDDNYNLCVGNATLTCNCADCHVCKNYIVDVNGRNWNATCCFYNNVLINASNNHFDQCYNSPWFNHNVFINSDVSCLPLAMHNTAINRDLKYVCIRCVCDTDSTKYATMKICMVDAFGPWEHYRINAEGIVSCVMYNCLANMLPVCTGGNRDCCYCKRIVGNWTFGACTGTAADFYYDKHMLDYVAHCWTNNGDYLMIYDTKGCKIVLDESSCLIQDRCLVGLEADFWINAD